MPKRHDDSGRFRDEDLEKLEDEMVRAAGQRPDMDLPSPLYRLKTTHSSETFFGWMEPDLYPVEPIKAEPEAPAGSMTGPVQDPAGKMPDTMPEAESPEPVKEELTGDPVPGSSGQKADPADIKESVQVAEESWTLAVYKATGELPQKGYVVAPTRYGHDLCEVQGIVRAPDSIQPDEIVEIERIATPEDVKRFEANREKEIVAFELCRQRIDARGLAMKLVSTHYLLDEPKILFYFSAEARVDFRELVKDLVTHFKMRIELRQIGVRDEARITGGMGVCGRVLCCHGVSDRLVPVSIKMAKDQNLSLNSMKISGPCGRLLCCLAYEYSFYRDARRELPNEGARFMFEGVLFKVIEVNALSATVKVAGEDGRILDMPSTRFMFTEGRWQVRPGT